MEGKAPFLCVDCVWWEGLGVRMEERKCKKSWGIYSKRDEIERMIEGMVREWETKDGGRIGVGIKIDWCEDFLRINESPRILQKQLREIGMGVTLGEAKLMELLDYKEILE